MPLWRLLRVKQRPFGSDLGLVRWGIWPWQRARMGDVRLGGSDEGDADAELLRRLGPPACHRPDAALSPERDSGFGGDRRGAGDLPRGSGNRLADRLELHHTVWRSAVRLARVRCDEPRGGSESLRVDLIRLSGPVSADDRCGYRRVGGLLDEFDLPHGGRRNEGRRLRVRGTYSESDGHPNLGLLGIHRMDGGSGGRRRLECNRSRPASVHRRTVRPELGPHHGDLYRDRDRSGDRLPRSTETASPSASVPADPAGPTGPAAVAAGRSLSLDLENTHGVARGRGFSPERPRYRIGPGGSGPRAFVYSALGRRYSADSKTHRASPLLTHSVSWNSLFVPSERFVQPATNPATKGHAGLSRRPSCRAARPIAVPSENSQRTEPVASSYSISQRPQPAPDRMLFPRDRRCTLPSLAGASLGKPALTSAPFQPDV